MSSQIEQIEAEVNGVRFAALTAGDGPLALCLHGFPDTAHTWRHLLPALADAGYRAVAPFTRGYAPTAVPADGRYQSAVLAADANGFHEQFAGDGDSVIIGHDWGAPATYLAAAIEPDRWSKVVGLAVPPGAGLINAFFTDVRQLQRSLYMFFFQHPLSDLLISNNDLAFVEMLWADWSPGFDAAEDLAHVRNSLGDPANLAAALGYYRAALGDGYKDPALDEQQAMSDRLPTQPTLYLHGSVDGCVDVSVARASAAAFPDNIRLDVVDGAAHFLQLEQPAVVNQLILDFLGAP